MKKLNVLFSPPDITEEEIAEVVDTLKSVILTTRYYRGRNCRGGRYPEKWVDYNRTENKII